nr:MAG TPA: hypothetical protein [Caudoviricetes sp.]
MSPRPSWRKPVWVGFRRPALGFRAGSIVPPTRFGMSAGGI